MVVEVLLGSCLELKIWVGFLGWPGLSRTRGIALHMAHLEQKLANFRDQTKYQRIQFLKPQGWPDPPIYDTGKSVTRLWTKILKSYSRQHLVMLQAIRNYLHNIWQLLECAPMQGQPTILLLSLNSARTGEVVRTTDFILSDFHLFFQGDALENGITISGKMSLEVEQPGIRSMSAGSMEVGSPHVGLGLLTSSPAVTYEVRYCRVQRVQTGK